MLAMDVNDNVCYLNARVVLGVFVGTPPGACSLLQGNAYASKDWLAGRPPPLFEVSTDHKHPPKQSLQRLQHSLRPKHRRPVNPRIALRIGRVSRAQFAELWVHQVGAMAGAG